MSRVLAAAAVVGAVLARECSLQRIDPEGSASCAPAASTRRDPGTLAAPLLCSGVGERAPPLVDEARPRSADPTRSLARSLARPLLLPAEPTVNTGGALPVTYTTAAAEPTGVQIAPTGESQGAVRGVQGARR